MVAKVNHSGSSTQAEGETRRETASGRSKSRGHYISEEYAVRFVFVNQILQAFQVDPQSVTDGFSSDSNHRFSKYYTIDRQGPWESTMWLNPPWSKWNEVARRVLQSDCAFVFAHFGGKSGCCIYSWQRLAACFSIVG